MWGVFINYFIQLVKKVDNTQKEEIPDVIEKDPVRISAQSFLCSLE